MVDRDSRGRALRLVECKDWECCDGVDICQRQLERESSEGRVKRVAVASTDTWSNNPRAVKAAGGTKPAGLKLAGAKAANSGLKTAISDLADLKISAAAAQGGLAGNLPCNIQPATAKGIAVSTQRAWAGTSWYRCDGMQFHYGLAEGGNSANCDDGNAIGVGKGQRSPHFQVTAVCTGVDLAWSLPLPLGRSFDAPVCLQVNIGAHQRVQSGHMEIQQYGNRAKFRTRLRLR